MVIKNMEELINKLVKEDKDFTEAKFKTKADNIYIQIFTAIMKQDLIRIKHFVSEEIYNELETKVASLQKQNLIQMYGELNVTDTKIINILEDEEKFQIEVSLLTKYLDYRIDKNTKKIISGNAEIRKEEYKKLIFTKIKNAKKLGTSRTCESCGANLDINFDGRCPYCGNIFKLQNYDWILKEIC